MFHPLQQFSATTLLDMSHLQAALLPILVLDPHSLAEHIEDALFRALDGLDIGDFGLFASALTKDTILQIDGKEHAGVDAITREFYGPISLLHTTHFATNVRVLRKSTRTAELSAKVLAQDYSFLANTQAASSPPHMLSGSFHRVALSLLRGETWRITHWKITTVWSNPAAPETVEPAPPTYSA